MRSLKIPMPTLEGERVRLVPYLREHVPRYHAWMSSPALRELTASEPLSLEQEYQMQASWSADPDKYTFIVLDRSLPDTPGVPTVGGAMAGDVNIFFREDIGPDAAEVEVMIAEERSRRKGLAREAVELMLEFARGRLGVHRFVAKVAEGNAPSLALFRDKLGFRDVAFADAFREHHLERRFPAPAPPDGPAHPDGSAPAPADDRSPAPSAAASEDPLEAFVAARLAALQADTAADHAALKAEALQFVTKKADVQRKTTDAHLARWRREMEKYPKESPEFKRAEEKHAMFAMRRARVDEELGSAPERVEQAVRDVLRRLAPPSISTAS